jgi:hypothetical protein
MSGVVDPGTLLRERVVSGATEPVAKDVVALVHDAATRMREALAIAARLLDGGQLVVMANAVQVIDEVEVLLRADAEVWDAPVEIQQLK